MSIGEWRVMMSLKQLFCSHDYHLINQTEVPSEFDVVAKSGYIPNSHCSLKRLIVTDYKCSKCNHLKRLTAKTPN
jgi:hypothetical protein